MIRCPQCQAEVTEGKRFCPQCGARMPEPPAQQQPAAPETPDIGRTVLLPPEPAQQQPAAPETPDIGRTVLLPPEPDAARTVVVPPPAPSDEPPSSAGQQTILAGPPPQQGAPTMISPPTQPTGGGFGLPASPPPTQPTGGGFGLPASPPPTQPTGGGFGLSASPPPTQPTGGGFTVPSSPPPSGGGFTVPSSPGAVQDAPPPKKGMNIWMILGIIAGVFVLACILLFAVGAYFVQQQVGDVIDSIPSPVIDTESPSFITEYPTVLEENGLDNDLTGAFTAETTDFADYRYEDGAYVIEITEPEYLAWQMISGVQTDVAYVIDATISGPDETAATLLFRYQDEQNFYAFSVNGRGEYRVMYYENDEPVILEDWTSSSAINPTGAANNLRIEMNGSTLTFFANDQELTTISDSTFPAGELGFATETFTDGNGSVAFDNLLVRGR